MGRKISDVYRELEPYIVDLVNANLRGSLAAASGGSGSGLVAHALNGPYHTGALDQSQAPWFGVHAANANAHHPEIHAITGADHTYAGGAALDLFGLTAPSTIGVITPSSNPGATAAVLRTTAAGALTLAQLLLANGTVGAPALAFSSDTNMGLYRIGTDIMGFATNGTERMRIDSNGQVGIGNTSPGAKLDVLTTSTSTSALSNGVIVTNTVSPTADSTAEIRALNMSVTINTGYNLTGSNLLLGIRGEVRITNAATIGMVTAGVAGYGLVAGTSALTSGAITEVNAFLGQSVGSFSNPLTATITRAYGAHIKNLSNTGTGPLTITSQIGVGVDALSGATNNTYLLLGQSTAPSGNWGIYNASANSNYINGPLGIGISSFTEKLNVNGSVKLGTFFTLDNTLKSIGVGTTPDGAALADFKAVNASDHTVRIKQLTSQTGRLWRVEDTSGNELIVLDSAGDLQSGQPGFVSGLTGWQITPTGNAEFNNAFIRGELHASIFVMDEFHASGGTLWIANAGKLENPWTVNLTTGNELVLDLRTTSVTGSGLQLDLRTTSVTGSGTQLTTRNITNYIDITDPPSGHAMLFSASQTLRLKALGNTSPGIDLYDIWSKILYVEDQTSFYRYYTQVMSGGAHGVIIPAGTADVSYGKKGDGRILLTSDQNYAPYMDVFTVGDQPWLGEITPHVRIGRLDGVGVPGVSGIQQYGIVAGTDLSNANSPYLVMSNLKQYMYRIGSEWNNGIDPTVTISPDGRFKIGHDVSDPNRTVFDFDPALGTLNIGSAAYPFAVSLVGNMTIQNPGAIATTTLNNDAGWTLGAAWGTNVTGIPTALTDGRIAAGLDASGNVITKVLPGSNVGTPGGAGLFLGADKMGYYSGGAWTLYMDNTGKMGLGGTSGARLAWDGTDLYGTDGTNVQWYARASTGKMYAGVGAVTLDRNGVTLTSDTTDSYLTQADANALTFNRTGTGTIGRVAGYYKSSGTQYGMDAYAMSPNSEAVVATLQAIALGNIYAGGAPGNARLRLQSGATDSAKMYANTIQFFATGSATPSIEAVANQVNIYDDLRLGGSTNHALGIRTTA